MQKSYSDLFALERSGTLTSKDKGRCPDENKYKLCSSSKIKGSIKF